MEKIAEKDLVQEIITAHHGIPVQFQHARRLEDLFSSVEVKTDFKQPSPITHTWHFHDCDLATGRRFKATATLSAFCGVRHAPNHLWLTPAAPLLDYMTEHCIKGAHYAYSFQITIRDSGSALIVANPSQILASYWLAIIPAANLPAELFQGGDE